MSRYEEAKKIYAKFGVDTDAAIERISKITSLLNLIFFCISGFLKSRYLYFNLKSSLVFVLSSTSNGKIFLALDNTVNSDILTSILPNLDFPNKSHHKLNFPEHQLH